MYLYCQNTECGVYLGSLGGLSCGVCGWYHNEPTQEQDITTTQEDVLNACITYVVHSEADFSGMPDALCEYFKCRVDALKHKKEIFDDQ